MKNEDFKPGKYELQVHNSKGVIIDKLIVYHDGLAGLRIYGSWESMEGFNNKSELSETTLADCISDNQVDYVKSLTHNTSYKITRK